MANMKGTVGQTYKPRSGNTYTADSNGNLKQGNVVGVQSVDVNEMLLDGCSFAASSQAQGANGLYATTLRLSEFKNTDGSALSAAASAGKFGFGVTLGANFNLVSEAANNNSKTDDAVFEYILPSNYVAGQNLTVTVNAATSGAGTLSVKTAQVKAFRIAADGTAGADIGPGAATAITSGGADIAFTVTGTTLNPGDKVLLQLETVLTETAASATFAKINSVRVS
ncbi:hypothetical protein [Roseicella sp. DB1501]|uniref:hypothetical protein n=1 Tax=Roseicella sp. DB1501 TaxID=2730925 RepID=UPI00149311EE|nr:hypothetical protein [Roseicella sp. DB1501]NOG73764.1 hypothetical protein [Roseicella sp. DB1501]